MASVGELGATALRRVDERTLGLLFSAVSVRAASVRRRLDRSGLAYVGRAGEPPAAWELARSADVVIGWTRATASFVGGVTGLAGALGVPPEAAAWIASAVRMTQRVGVVYGFDPDTERGRAALGDALAAAFDVELPEQGPDRMRLTDLLGNLGGASAEGTSVPAVIARAVVVRTALRLVGRVGRLVPLLSSGVSAVDGQARTSEVGDRVKRVYQRLSELPTAASSAGVEDAIEVKVDRERPPGG